MAFSVLVVEDEFDWRKALCKMYQDLLSEEDPTVQSAATVPDARRALSNEDYDLLSLDINMASTHPAEGDGRTLVREASESGAVGLLVVITGMEHDEELDAIINQDERVEEARVQLGTYLDGYFSGSYLHIPKPQGKSAGESVPIIRNALTRHRLKSRSGTQNVFRWDGQFWHLQYGGQEERLSDKKGMRSIHYLLQQASKNKPDVSAHELDRLENPTAAGMSMSEGRVTEEGMSETTGDNYDLELDKHDQTRLRKIEEELDQCEQRLDEIEERYGEIEEDVHVRRVSDPQDEIGRLQEEERVLKQPHEELINEQMERRKK
jgi:CheY-like chemotaxis protein